MADRVRRRVAQVARASDDRDHGRGRRGNLTLGRHPERRHRRHHVLGLHGPGRSGHQGRRCRSAEVTLEKLRRAPRQARRARRCAWWASSAARTSTATCPSRSAARQLDDWVIKDDLYAVWVSGKKPKGQGWALDAGAEARHRQVDRGRRPPETRRGVTYIRAHRGQAVRPAQRDRADGAAAAAAAGAAEGRRPWSSSRCRSTARPRSRATAASSCSSARTWTRRRSPATSCCRYAGPVLPGDRAFDGMKLTLRRGPPRAHRRPRRPAASGPPDRADPAAGHPRHRRPAARPRAAPRRRATSSTCCATSSGSERAAPPSSRTTISGSTNSAAGRRQPRWRKRADLRVAARCRPAGRGRTRCARGAGRGGRGSARSTTRSSTSQAAPSRGVARGRLREPVGGRHLARERRHQAEGAAGRR